jgi:hypothetical protein
MAAGFAALAVPVAILAVYLWLREPIQQDRSH